MIVVLDACVLPSLRDLLLTLAALDAFDVRWSDEILDEVTRNVTADHPDIDAAKFVEHTIGAMRVPFPRRWSRLQPGSQRRSTTTRRIATSGPRHWQRRQTRS